jgi:hypothetical protein
VLLVFPLIKQLVVTTSLQNEVEDGSGRLKFKVPSLLLKEGCVVHAYTCFASNSHHHELLCNQVNLRFTFDG